MRVALIALGSVGTTVLVVVGIASVKWYLWDIVIGQAGEADRSMLFWGLPILFIGGFAFTAGVALAVAVVRHPRHRP